MPADRLSFAATDLLRRLGGRALPTRELDGDAMEVLVMLGLAGTARLKVGAVDGARILHLVITDAGRAKLSESDDGR